MRAPKSSCRESGSSMILLLVILGLISFIGMVYVPVYQQQMKGAQRINTNFSALVLTNNLYNILNNDSAWDKILNDDVCNPHLRCFKNNTSCYTDPIDRLTPDINGSWRINCLYDIGGKIFDSTSVASQGFSLSSESCDGFSDEIGNVECPFRPVVTFALRDPAACASGPCIDPPVTITINLVFNDGRDYPFKASKFKQSIVRD